MSFLERFRRRHRESRFILRLLGILLVCLTAVYYLLQARRELPSALVANKVLLFVLWYINLVLILTILFVLARSLFKLLVERRARILGAKFKSKLVATYVGLALVPVLLLALYATQLLQQSVDSWFAAPVETVLAEGSAVAEGLLSMVQADTTHDAKALAAELAGIELDRPRQRARLDRRLQPALARQGLDFLGVYIEADFVGGVVNPEAGLVDLPEPGRAVLLEAATGGEGVRRMPPPSGGGQLVLAAVPIPNSSPAGGVLVAGRLLPPEIASQGERLILAYQGYRQLESQKEALTASQLLILFMVTLLILLASTWVGLYLARRVTVPIQALAEGTKLIRGGDLSHRVEVEADDELGVLVDSFNQMTGDLERNRRLLEEGNRDLSAANQRLAEERALLVAVLQGVAAGVVAFDRDERVFLCNGAALAMLRQSEEQLRGRSIREAWADPERGKLLATLDEGPPAADEREVRLVVGGEWKTLAIKRTPLLGSPSGRSMATAPPPSRTVRYWCSKT